MTATALLALCCWLLACHPFITYPASLMIARRYRHPTSRSRRNNGAAVHSVAVCFSVYNEGNGLTRKIDNLHEVMRLAPVPVGVYAYVDGASDNSESLLRAARPALAVYAEAANRGKSHGLNQLMEQVSAEIVVFTDANVTFAPDVIAKLIPYFSDPDIGCVCGRLCYTNLDEGATAYVGGTYWHFEERLKQLESDTGNVMGADGSLFAVRRTLFSPIPPETIPDMFVSFETLFKGYRIIAAPDVVAYERTAVNHAEEFQRKIRIACRAFNYHRAVRHRLRSMAPWDRYKYFSHKFLRWLSFVWLSLAFALTGSLILGVYGTLLLSLAFLLLLWVGQRYRIPVISQAASIAAATFATTIGICHSLVGRRYVSWQPAATAR